MVGEDMKCKIKAKILKGAITSIKALVEEATFSASDSGIKLLAMDASQIALVSLEIPKTAFLEYPLMADTKFRCDITQLLDVVSRAKDEVVEINVDDRLTLCFLGEGKKKTFKLPLLEIENATETKEPSQVYDTFVQLNADIMQSVIQDSKLSSSHITFVVDGIFKVSAKNESSDFVAEYEQCEYVNLSGNAKATFPTKFVEDMLRATDTQTSIRLNLATDRPLKLEYVIENVKVCYWLAPRVDAE